jgi:hypothetical protein
MASLSRINKAQTLSQNKKAIEGVGKWFGKQKSLSLAGESTSPAQLKAVFQAESDALDVVDATRATLAKQMETLREAQANAHSARTNLHAYIVGNYGANAVEMLGDFGMAPAKRRAQPTVETKATAKKKAAATRKARGTMGPKEKKKIVGVVVETAAPAAPSPAPGTNGTGH